MEEFIKQITSTSWWIGVVAVGIAINLISTYLKPAFDRVASNVSTTWRSQVDQRTIARKEKLEYLRTHPSEQVFLGLEALALRARANYYFYLTFNMMVAALLLKVVGKDIVSEFVPMAAFGMGTLMFSFGTAELLSYTRAKTLLNEARQSKFASYVK